MRTPGRIVVSHQALSCLPVDEWCPPSLARTFFRICRLRWVQTDGPWAHLEWPAVWLLIYRSGLKKTCLRQLLIFNVRDKGIDDTKKNDDKWKTEKQENPDFVKAPHFMDQQGEQRCRNAKCGYDRKQKRGIA